MKPFFSSYVSPRAKEYVAQVLDSGMLSEGEWVRRFEQAIEKFLHFKENTVVATNSGTSALHLALKTLGIGEGDEVIIPPLTFVATGLAVLYCGAKPVFADIGADGCIDPDIFSALISRKTKAVIGVNWAGKDCNQRIYNICRFNDLKFIVDAAQSFGSRIQADAVCYSFQAIKHVTTGDGGAVFFKDPADYQRARKLSWFGIDKEKDLPDILGERVYNLQEVGYKYHMNNVAAAIGLANIEMAYDILEYRRILARVYEIHLESVSPVHQCGTGADPDKSTFWAYPVRVDDARRFSAYCEGTGVPHSVIHRGIDHNRIFGGVHMSLQEQRRWEQTVVHLPIHCDMTAEDVLSICEKVNEYAQ